MPKLSAVDVDEFIIFSIELTDETNKVDGLPVSVSSMVLLSKKVLKLTIVSLTKQLQEAEDDDQFPLELPGFRNPVKLVAILLRLLIGLVFGHIPHIKD